MNLRYHALVAVSGLALLSAVCVVGLLLGPVGPPAVLGAAPPVAEVPAESVEFDDRRTVSISLERTPESSLTLPAAGVLTWSDCSAGGSLASGELVAKVDEKPVLALAGAVPFYRDLGIGARGADVAALQEELARLGYRTPRDGRFTTATGRALDQVFRAHGVRNPAPGRLARGSVVWLPQAAVVVSECLLSTGGTAAPGVPFATLPGRLHRVSLSTVPSGMAAGDRTLTVFGVTGPMTDDHGSVDPAFVDAVAGTPEAAVVVQAAADSDDSTISGVVQLAERLPALRVPVAAVFGVRETSACVSIAGSAVPVAIVGSSLGTTIVRLPDDVSPPSEVRLVPNDTTVPCGR